MPHSKTRCYEFGPFHLDVAQQVLRRDGEAVALTPKATEILTLLVRNAGQLVEKENLMTEVWPDTFVEEANVTQNVFKLRRALGDDRAEPKFIETVARRGYRFIAPVRTVTCAGSQFGDSGVDSESDLPENAFAPPRILAVLPFINATGDENLEYLAEGVTENIINSLSGISKLRVMSRSTVFRYKNRNLEAKTIGRELGVDALLVGKIRSRPSGLSISVELVKVPNGWQLWGESFDCELSDILEIQDQIAMQLSATLRLKLTGEEEKRITARYTENAEAYQSYLEGRYHWSRYNRRGIERAISHFRKAIELDPNYALAYAGIVDCYLRLTTNYLPPEDDEDEINRCREPADQAESPQPPSRIENQDPQSRRERVADVTDPKVKLRHEWDWKGAERELRRANELKSDYPAAHQWYAAYLFARRLFLRTQSEAQLNEFDVPVANSGLISQLASVELTRSEQVQVYCTIAREQIAVGNFDAGNLVLKSVWCGHDWPTLEGLSPHTAADLVFTLGALIGNLAGAGRMSKGQKYAEGFLNGSIAIFEQLGSKSRSSEARLELARCYYREGLFDLARETLECALDLLPLDQTELRSVCLVLLGAIYRDTGRLEDSTAKLLEATTLEVAGQLATGRCYLELATTLKERSAVDTNQEYAEQAKQYFQQALYESEAIGNHRLAAAVENNLGFFLMSLRLFQESESHLLRSRKLFETFGDEIRFAQVNESLARLYVSTLDYPRAKVAVDSAVETLELNDGEALLAEALTTKGLVECREHRFGEGLRALEGAHRVAERCGDHEGAGRALLTILEELPNHLGANERRDIVVKLQALTHDNEPSSLSPRIHRVLASNSPIVDEPFNRILPEK
jgi:DNA-binding winged helix-turn-helix (wHTH) protein/tetratricopeptide (TPR) repeat protein